MFGMASKSWIVDLLDPVVVFKESRYFNGALIVLFHPQGQGFQSPIQKKACMGIKSPAQVIELVGDLADELGRTQ